MRFVDIIDEGLKHAYEDADKHLWTKEELDAYDYASMRKQDERGKTTVAVRRAVEKPVGKTKEYEKTVIAMEMINDNEPIEKIVKYTKLSKDKVEKLISKLKNE